MDFLNELLNQPLLKIGRASDLFWMLFGNSILDSFQENKTTEKFEYALHLQCPWRIRSKGDSQIQLASDDIYQPTSLIKWSPEFDWDVQGNNLFDEKAQKLFSDNNLVFVKRVSISKNNDLQLEFSNHLILECFVNTSTFEECWRFFRQNGDRHLVAKGSILEFQ
ncbi:hypothetical protein CE91St44_27180 [Oscillospiraceae bacterium]|nr:hypothetical protein CE91St44_27180 [Oscillospiraceae bacterium]